MDLRVPLLSLALVGLALAGCSSPKEPGMARSLDYQRPAGEGPTALGPAAAPPAPKAAPIQPKGVKIKRQAPLRPAWKGERVRALDIDRTARDQVEESRSRAFRGPGVGSTEAKIERAHRVRTQVARRRAVRALAAIERAEGKERKRLRAEAVLGRTLNHSLARQEAYLAAARAQTGRNRSSDLVPVSRRIAARAEARVQACAELYAEQLERVERSRRVTLATLAQGVAVSGGRLELRQEVRRLTQVRLVWDAAVAEALYAQSVAARLDAQWNLALSQDPR